MTVAELTSRAAPGRSLVDLEAESRLATARLQRLEELLQVEAVSSAAVEEARARAATLRSELNAVRGGGGRRVSVRAPFSGRIAEVFVVPGQAVEAGAALARVVRTKPVWIEVALRPEASGLLAQGPIGLVIQPSGGLEPITLTSGQVRLVSRAPEIDRTTGTVKAIFETSADVPLRIGAAVEAEVLLPQQRLGVVVPSSAVVDDSGVPIVYVQTDGESFLRQEVRIVARQGTRVLVEGVLPADRYVTVGAAAIRRAAQLGSGPIEGHAH